MLSQLRLGPRGGRLGWGRHATPTPMRQPPSSTTRNFSQQQSHHQLPIDEQISVRILRPAVWSAAAIGTIYFTCAAYDVHQDVKGYRKDQRQALTFEQIENDRASRLRYERSRSQGSSSRFGDGPIAVESPRALWDSLSGPGQVMASVFAVNAATLTVAYMPSIAAQRFYLGLGHIPVEGMFRYRQLITSAFGHTGVIHLGMNMFVMFNFASSLAQTSVFKGSGSHTAAFYLSGGIISALGNHISTRFWPNKLARFVPSMGFSGVVSAIFAGWCMENPDARVGIMFLPFTFTAQGMLAGLTVFEILGVLRLFSMGVAHSAHLTGLAFGASYVAYGQGERLWTPFRRAAFRSLKTTGMI